MQKSFTDTLRDLGQGTFVDEASDALTKLVNTVEETGRAGSLTITLKLKKAVRGTAALIMQDDIKLTLPKQDARETMLFATPEGNLITEDPRQQKLELKNAGAPTPGELKIIPAPSAQLKAV